jgi:hypothetical protein
VRGSGASNRFLRLTAGAVARQAAVPTSCLTRCTVPVPTPSVFAVLRIPAPVAKCARLRIVRLPDSALTANDEARDHIIKPIIIDHWRENGGRVPAFGGITGYVLVLVAGYGGFDLGCLSA